MAKDLVSSLGNAELNALMAVQLQKFNTANKKLNDLFQANNCIDFNNAYRNADKTENFIDERNKLLDELSDVLEVMNKLRVAQQNLIKNQPKN